MNIRWHHQVTKASIGASFGMENFPTSASLRRRLSYAEALRSRLEILTGADFISHEQDNGRKIVKDYPVQGGAAPKLANLDGNTTQADNFISCIAGDHKSLA